MKITIDRARCGHHPTACEECFGEFLRSGEPPFAGCVTEMRDNGEPEWVVKFMLGDQVGTLVVTRHNREQIIYNGWMKFVRLLPPAARTAAPGETPVYEPSRD